MTVKKKNRWINSLTVAFLILVLFDPLFAQQKNVLRVRFETAKVKPGTSVVLNVFYKIVGKKPVNFTGFDCSYSYDQTKIRPVNTFFDGTASANATFAHSNDDLTHNIYHIVVDNYPLSLDTSNPILFQVFYSVGVITDSAMISPIKFDVGGTGIDTVIIENSRGRDQAGWYPFGLVFLDTSKPPPPPKKKSITLSSDSTDIQSDSVKIVSLQVSSLDSTVIKSAIFEFDVDTGAFDSVAVTKGALLTNGVIAVSKDSSHIAVKFSNIDTSKAFIIGGELLKISFTGKKRSDTVCTGILHPKLTVLNNDNLVASVSYALRGICVLGKRIDTVVKGVVRSSENTDILMGIYPNPARSFIDFIMPDGSGGKKHLVVFDALGRIVFDQILDSNLHWETASVPAGIYTATLTDFSGLQNKAGAEKRKILIIH